MGEHFDLHKSSQLLTVPSPVNWKFEPTIFFLGKGHVAVAQGGSMMSFLPDERADRLKKASAIRRRLHRQFQS
jgi:hypothetical protein